jgi:hypothetical protein
MGTRAIVRVEGCDDLLYKQYDGYPEALGEMLHELTPDDLKTPATVKDALDKIQIEEHLADGMLGRDGEPLPYFSDLYIETVQPPDIEWIYFVSTDGSRITVTEVTG